MTELEKLEEQLCKLKDRESNLLREITELTNFIYRYKIKLSEQKFPKARGKLFWFSDTTKENDPYGFNRYIVGNIIRPFSREEIRFDGERRFYSVNKEGEEINHGYRYAFPVKSNEIKLYEKEIYNE